MNRVVHFEIYTDEPEAVQPFYQDVFGWKFKKFEGGPVEYWLVTTGDDKDTGINGGLLRPREGQSPGTINKTRLQRTSTRFIQFPPFLCAAIVMKASMLDQASSAAVCRSRCGAAISRRSTAGFARCIASTLLSSTRRSSVPRR